MAKDSWPIYFCLICNFLSYFIKWYSNDFERGAKDPHLNGQNIFIIIDLYFYIYFQMHNNLIKYNRFFLSMGAGFFSISNTIVLLNGIKQNDNSI